MKILTIHSKTLGKKEVYYDDEDEFFVSQHTWHVKRYMKYHQEIFYCHTNIHVVDEWEYCAFHRLLLGLTDPKIFVDHINHNGLDNQRGNLRICTRAGNNQNASIQQGRISVYKGVTFRKDRNPSKGSWRARIMFDRKNI